MKTKLNELQEAARQTLKSAEDIITNAGNAGREMTEQEKADVATFKAKGVELIAKIKTARADENVLGEMKALAEQIGESAAADVDVLGASGGADLRRRVKNLGLTVVESPQFKAALEGALAGGSRVSEKTRFNSGAIPVKSLFTGTSDTSAGAFVVAEQSGIVETLGRKPLTIRSLISVRRTTSDAIEYVRQTGHVNNAAPVPEATSTAPIGDGTLGTTTAVAGGLKPEGSWTYERDTVVVKTIAEWVPATKRALADVNALQDQIDDELRRDIAEAEEAQVLAGDGVGENLLGILNVGGTQGQLFDTDLVTTARRALTKARLGGRVNPTAFVFNPEEDEAIDLLRENGTSGAFLNGGPFASGVSTLWGVPRVSSENVPAGTFVLADWTKAVLWDREETTVSVTDSHADFFTRNLVAILAEERVAFGVPRPSAFVIGDARA